jgi:hypothetical protein
MNERSAYRLLVKGKTAIPSALQLSIFRNFASFSLADEFVAVVSCTDCELSLSSLEAMHQSCVWNQPLFTCLSVCP